jgi:plasmid stabilization system protein ParE
MPESYVFFPQARTDLRNIIAYIAQDNPGAARKIKTLMLNACTNLGKNPYIGQERSDLTTKAVRFWPVHHNYMIIYKPDTKPVQIIRIYNNARDINSILSI